MKIKSKVMWMFALVIICALLNVIVSDDSNIILFFLSTFATTLIIIDVLITSYKDGCLVGFFSLANIFLGLMFVVRPLQILITNDVSQFSNFRRYITYYGNFGMMELPWAKASLIGLLGVFFLNIPFLTADKDKKFTVTNAISFDQSSTLNNKQIGGLLFFGLAASVLAAIYGIKVLRSSSLHIYDLLWVFLFSSIFVYSIARRRDAGFLIHLIMALSIVLLSFRGRRQYAVNMLLCYVCPLYFAGKNRKRTFFRVGVMIVIILAVIFVFGNVRRELRGVLLQESFVDGILGEFSMFDMLLVSLRYVKQFQIGLFWGYNYLSIFTVPIPWLNIDPFDYRLTDIVFLGRFHGGIPTSVFGSLYFNFSFIGVCIGSLLVGNLFMRIQKRLSYLNNLNSIGFYSIVTTFVYDLIRVGDFGRETWSLLTFLIVYYMFISIMKRISNDRLVA